TTLVAFVPSSVIGTWLYARQRQVDFRTGIGLALLSVPGVFLGSVLAGVITERQAAIGLSALLVVVGLYIAQQSRRLKEQELDRSNDVDVV
ncbi:TSUP family transporter, partial [Escherichia coli]